MNDIDFNQLVFGYTFPPAYIHMLTQLLWVWDQLDLQDKEDDHERITLHTGNCLDCGQHRDLVNGRCVNTRTVGTVLCPFDYDRLVVGAQNQ